MVMALSGVMIATIMNETHAPDSVDKDGSGGEECAEPGRKDGKEAIRKQRTRSTRPKWRLQFPNPLAFTQLFTRSNSLALATTAYVALILGGL
jgi:hypothetical protein